MIFLFQGIQLIVNGQTGDHGYHVLKPVEVGKQNLQDTKLFRKVMVELVQAQVKNPGLVIAKAVLVSFHLHNCQTGLYWQPLMAEIFNIFS